MAKRQVMVWDANVHEDILISLFQHIKPSSDDWANVMQDLQSKGYSFTEGALRYDFQCGGRIVLAFCLPTQWFSAFLFGLLSNSSPPLSSLPHIFLLSRCLPFTHSSSFLTPLSYLFILVHTFPSTFIHWPPHTTHINQHFLSFHHVFQAYSRLGCRFPRGSPSCYPGGDEAQQGHPHQCRRQDARKGLFLFL